MDALNGAECTVLVMPCGRSAHLELGYACGAGQLTIAILGDDEPELMYKMCTNLVTDTEGAIECIKNYSNEMS